MSKHSAHAVGVRPTDEILASDIGEGDDAFLVWIEEVNQIANRMFCGIWDSEGWGDIDMWEAFCDGIPPVFYTIEYILPALVCDFGEEAVYEQVAKNMVWGMYR